MKKQCLTVIATASLGALLAGCASSNVKLETPPAVPENLPENLKAPATQVATLESRATGVQIYECGPSKDDPDRFEWVLKAPEAELLDRHGKKIGKHYAGPTWESNDGSSVIGEVVARSNSPDPNAIPWLLLKAKSASGNGVLREVQSIQRVNTVGGKAPAEGCNQAQAGQEARVNYQATYYFYVPVKADQK